MQSFAEKQVPTQHAKAASFTKTRVPQRAFSPVPHTQQNQPQTCACGGGCPRCQTAQINRQHNAGQARVPASGSAIGAQLGSLIDRSQTSSRLPSAAISGLDRIPGQTLEKIRIHDDPAAHEAARGLNARAFTIGPSIYFGRGEYQPTTSAGFRVLAHEAAHAHQQADASLPPTAQLGVSSSSSREEIAAEQFADGVSRGALVSPPAQAPTGTVARLMRLEFELVNPRNPEVVDITQRKNDAAGGPGGPVFSFGGGGNEKAVDFNGTIFPPELYLFNWGGELKIKGAPGDEFSKWRVGMLQTMRSYSIHVNWGASPNQTSCGGDVGAAQDGWELGNPWFRPDKTSEPFSADGDTRSTTFIDSPFVYRIPYQNPKTDRAEAFGDISYRASFITYLSAGYMPESVPLNFRHIRSVRWELNLKGTFDARQLIPVFEIKSGGTTVETPVDASSERPPVIGGELAQTAIKTTEECWKGK